MVNIPFLNVKVGLLLVFVGMFSVNCGKQDLFREVKIIMGTTVEVSVASGSEKRARQAIRDVFEEFERIDRLLGWRNPASLLAEIHREGHFKPVQVDPEVFSLLLLAEEISRESGGAFDVTVGPLSALWSFDEGGSLPKVADIGRILPMVGYQNLILDSSFLSVGLKIQGVRVDLGGIAKGFAVDRAVEILKDHGVTSAIIDAGGDLRLIGERPGGGGWRIGVQHPRDKGTFVTKFDLSDTAVVTSGDYERFFESGGERYHHILDPATGFPARGCQSVTVIARSAAEADACATAAFVLGPERGITFLRSRPGVRGMIVGADGSIHWSDPALEREARR